MLSKCIKENESSLVGYILAFQVCLCKDGEVRLISTGERRNIITAGLFTEMSCQEGSSQRTEYPGLQLAPLDCLWDARTLSSHPLCEIFLLCCSDLP